MIPYGCVAVGVKWVTGRDLKQAHNESAELGSLKRERRKT